MKSKAPTPAHIDGLTRLAAVIGGHFKIPCSKQNIKHWQKKNPPFPAPTQANRYDRAACFEWVTTYIVSEADATTQGDLFRREREAEAHLKIRKDKDAAFDFEVKRGKYIERAIANQSVIGALKSYHGFVRNELELNATATRRDKLTALGASQEIVTLFHEWDLLQMRAVIDRIEAQIEVAGNGN